MRAAKFRGLYILVQVLCLILGACRGGRSEPHRSFVIYVVGDGVPPIRKDINRLFPLNRAQGQAMWRGAKAALDYSPRLEKIRSWVFLKGFDDASLAEEASKFGKRMRERSEVIAIIGHATSQTTRSAITYYADAGIPIVMPIATSDLVMYPEGMPKHRVSNAFRLPPSDARAQAPAIAYEAQQKHFSRVLVIQDVSAGAEGYSSTLVNALAPLIRSKTVATIKVDRFQQQTLQDAADAARSNYVDAIVFCGYGSTAQSLFYILRESYKGRDASERPTIVLTDGCLVEDLNVAEFNSLLTFPHLGSDELGNAGQDPDARLVKGLYTSSYPLSYEPFGYDAMLILGQAMQACLEQENLSRRCIISKLTKPDRPFYGVTGVYEFERGENRHSKYDVFRSGADTGYKFDVSKKTVISAEDLSLARAGH